MRVGQHVQALKLHLQAVQPRPRRSKPAQWQAYKWLGASSEVPLRENFFISLWLCMLPLRVCKAAIVHWQDLLSKRLR